MKSLNLPRTMVGISLSAILFCACGCSSTSDTATAVSADQDKALKDPMHYSPTMDNTDITGGGIGSYNNDAMNRDLNDLFNP
jgi:hypothetical protein